MFIRKANREDYKRIARSLNNKQIAYITAEQALADILAERLYIIEESGKIIAQCALVYEANYQYHAIKRLTVYNKKNCGRGIAQQFISFFVSMNLPAIGCTPWSDNAIMKKLLSRNGFEYQYTFLENYEFFIKRG